MLRGLWTRVVELEDRPLAVASNWSRPLGIALIEEAEGHGDDIWAIALRHLYSACRNFEAVLVLFNPAFQLHTGAVLWFKWKPKFLAIAEALEEQANAPRSAEQSRQRAL